MSKKGRFTMTLDEPLVDYIDSNVDNRSGFINRALWDMLGDDPMAYPEADTSRVRQRVAQMHIEVLEKEIAELERQKDELERIVDTAHTDPSVMWRMRLDRIVHGRHAGRPYKQDMSKDAEADDGE